MKGLAENRRAYFDYQILETFEAGIVLYGFEVKAIKSGRINLSGSFAVPKDEEIWLINADIPPYQPKNTPRDYDPKRTRRLLLKKSEIKYLLGSITSRGLRLVPIKVYTKNNKIKLELGLARIRKKADKRQSLIKKAVEKEINRIKKDESR